MNKIMRISFKDGVAAQSHPTAPVTNQSWNYLTLFQMLSGVALPSYLHSMMQAHGIYGSVARNYTRALNFLSTPFMLIISFHLLFLLNSSTKRAVNNKLSRILVGSAFHPSHITDSQIDSPTGVNLNQHVRRKERDPHPTRGRG